MPPKKNKTNNDLQLSNTAEVGVMVQEFDLILFCAFQVTGYVNAGILIAAKLIYVLEYLTCCWDGE